MQRKIPAAILFFALLMTSFSAAAEEHTRDGLFLRLQAGAGWLGIEDQAPTPAKFSGVAAAFNFGLGLSLFENFAIYGEVSVYVAPGPTLTVGDTSTTANEKVQLSVGGLGAGVTYYFWEGLFVAGGFRVSQMRTEIYDEEASETRTVLAESDFGATVPLQLGMEWWVGPEWGLGVAGEMAFGTVYNDRSNWTVNQYSVLFTSTFN